MVTTLVSLLTHDVVQTEVVEKRDEARGLGAGCVVEIYI